MSKVNSEKLKEIKKRRRKSSHACKQTRRITSSLVIIILLVKIIRLVSSVSLMKFIFVACKWSCICISQRNTKARECESSFLIHFGSGFILSIFILLRWHDICGVNQHTYAAIESMAEVKWDNADERGGKSKVQKVKST